VAGFRRPLNEGSVLTGVKPFAPPLVWKAARLDRVAAAGSAGYYLVAGGLLMSITVRIPSTLRQYTEQKSEIALEGKTVGEVLDNLKARFPEIGDRCFSTRMSRFMNIYLNDRDIRSLNDRDTPVADQDVLSIVFAIAGG
jgi:molybdopterin converting factor small subunit